MLGTNEGLGLEVKVGSMGQKVSLIEWKEK